MTPALGRCPFRGCPVRYRDGQDRLCTGHSGEQDQRRLLDSLGLTPAPDGEAGR